MNTLQDVLNVALKRHIINITLARVESEIEGTFLGEIVSTFTFMPFHTFVYTQLGEIEFDFEENMGIDEDDYAKESLYNSDYFYFLYENKYEFEDDDEVREKHPNIIGLLDENRIYFPYFNAFENTTMALFSNDIDTLVDDYIDKDYKGSADIDSDEFNDVIKEYFDKYPNDHLFRKIDDLPKGLMSEFDEDSEVHFDILHTFISEVLELDDSLLSLNAKGGFCSSLQGYNRYKDLYFKNKKMPPHLTPIFKLKREDDIEKAINLKAAGCRIATRYDILEKSPFLLCKDMKLFDFIYVRQRRGEHDYPLANTPKKFEHLRSFMSEFEGTIVFENATAHRLSKLMDDFYAPEYCLDKNSSDYLEFVVEYYRSEGSVDFTTFDIVMSPKAKVQIVTFFEDLLFRTTPTSSFKELELVNPLSRFVKDDEYYTTSFELMSFNEIRRYDKSQNLSAGADMIDTVAFEIDVPNEIPILGLEDFCGKDLVSTFVQSVYMDDYIAASNSLKLDDNFYLALESVYPSLSKSAGSLSYYSITDRVTVAFNLKLKDPNTAVVLNKDRDSYPLIVTQSDSLMSIVLNLDSDNYDKHSSRQVQTFDTAIQPYVREFGFNYTKLNTNFDTGVATDSYFSKLFGFNGKKLYKNSNFIAYSYIYLFVPQIIGRFGEHVQNHILSQTLPLGTVIDEYFASIENPPRNPKQFLETAKQFNSKGINPIAPVETYTEMFESRKFVDLTENEFVTYMSPIRFLYSFIDTYTKPLSILYNALQFSSARANPELRTDRANIANNYSLNYSDGSWVEEYLRSLENSQGSDFASRSLFLEATHISADLIGNEVQRFLESAEVKEYFEISTIERLQNLYSTYREDPLFNTINEQVTPTKAFENSNGDISLYDIFDSSTIDNMVDARMLKNRSEFTSVSVFDNEGAFEASPFSQQLTASITFISKLASFVIGTFYTEGFENSSFCKLFMSGDSSQNAPVKNTIDFRDILKFPVITNKISKLIKNPIVKFSVGGRQVERRLAVANLSKQIIPLDLIRYLIKEHFSDTYEFAPMGIDARSKIPSTKRMSLGAFSSIFICLAASKRKFLGLQNASIYGPIVAVSSNDVVDFDDYSEYDEAEDTMKVNLDSFSYVVRQATASEDDYANEDDSLFSASDSAIADRLSNLSSAYSICIGQAGFNYIKDAQNKQLDVFTFFKGDNNLSTLGFQPYALGYNDVQVYSIVDSNGEDNRSCSSNTAEGCQFILNWLASVVLGNIISKSEIQKIMQGNTDLKINPKFELNLGYGGISSLFEMNNNVRFKYIKLGDTENAMRHIGVCTQMREVFDGYSDKEVSLFAEYARKHLCRHNFFNMLFGEDSHSSDKLDNRDILENIVTVYKKPLFRA